MTRQREPMLAGWREWVALPSFGIDSIEAKLDTGAHTSALHAKSVRRYTEGGAPWILLEIQTSKQNRDSMVLVETPIKDTRMVTDSGGHSETRIVVESELQIGMSKWWIEVTITNRDSLRYLMLIGRSAMEGRLWVDPAKKFLVSSPPP